MTRARSGRVGSAVAGPGIATSVNQPVGRRDAGTAAAQRPWTNCMASDRVGRVAPEQAPDGRGDGRGARLLHAPHRHAQVLGLDHHQDPPGVEGLLDGVGDLGGHPLLDLQALGEAVDQAGQLGEPGDPAVRPRDVGHVGPPHERDQVVLAQRGERDVADHDHLVVVGGERHLEVVGRILVEPGEELLVHPGHPAGRHLEAVAVGVLADGGQDLPDGRSIRFVSTLIVRIHLSTRRLPATGMSATRSTWSGTPRPVGSRGPPDSVRRVVVGVDRPAGCGSARPRRARSRRRSRPGW